MRIECEYYWVYLWVAADAVSGDSIAMITPTVNAKLMQLFIDGPETHQAARARDPRPGQRQLAPCKVARVARELHADVLARLQPRTEPSGEPVAITCVASTCPTKPSTTRTAC